MKPSRVEEVLGRLMDTEWAVFIWGPPGVGKSSVVRRFAATAKMDVIDIRASLLDPTDIRGIPSIEGGRAVWCPPSFLPSKEQDPGVLFLDELNVAPPLVQASLYQLTLDRRVGEYQLPDGWKIIAAGNRAQDASVVHRMPAALSNRFIHIDFEVDMEDWRAWAIENRMDPRVLGFLAVRPALLHDMSRVDRAFPTPRSWHMLSDVLSDVQSVDDVLDVAIGVVGEGAAMEFHGYCKQAISFQSIQKIVESPADAPLPQSLGDLYAVISWMASNGAAANVRSAAGVLLNRISPELGVFLARDMIRASPKFLTDKHYLVFVSRHKEFLK